LKKKVNKGKEKEEERRRKRRYEKTIKEERKAM
jgi:hypothetical protein